MKLSFSNSFLLIVAKFSFFFNIYKYTSSRILSNNKRFYFRLLNWIIFYCLLLFPDKGYDYKVIIFGCLLNSRNIRFQLHDNYISKRNKNHIVMHHEIFLLNLWNPDFIIVSIITAAHIKLKSIHQLKQKFNSV